MRAYGLTALRVFVGAVFILHGVEKLFGLWGGGLAETTAMAERFHLPAPYPFAVLAAAAELAGGVLLFVGGFTLWTSVVLLVARLALFYQQYRAGAFSSAAADRTEFELSLLLVGALVALVLSGPGAWSLDDRRVRSAEHDAAGRAPLRSGRA